jgi:hypothetical protein
LRALLSPFGHGLLLNKQDLDEEVLLSLFSRSIGRGHFSFRLGPTCHCTSKDPLRTEDLYPHKGTLAYSMPLEEGETTWRKSLYNPRNRSSMVGRVLPCRTLLYCAQLAIACVLCCPDQDESVGFDPLQVLRETRRGNTHLESSLEVLELWYINL